MHLIIVLYIFGYNYSIGNDRIKKLNLKITNQTQNQIPLQLYKSP
jgi:hypothetical protein